MLRANGARLFVALGVLSLTAGLVGCDAGIKKDPDDVTAIGTSTACGVSSSDVSLSYLFFSTLDSTCPGKPTTVDAATDVQLNIFNPPWIFLAGTYDSATQSVNSVHHHALVYAKPDGKLYKASALKSNGTPTSTPLSSAGAADKICSAFVGAIDFEDADHSQIVYRAAGSNASCSENDVTYKMVRLSMGSADAPIAAKHPLGTALYDWATGAISGWLVNDAGVLKRCDANFQNCIGSKSITRAASQLLNAGSNRWLLEIDSVVYVYDGNPADVVPKAIHPIGGTNQVVTLYVTDGSDFYFVTGNAPKQIYKAPVDGSTEAVPLVTESAYIIDLALTANKLLYRTATPTAIYSVAKAGGSASVLIGGDTSTVVAINGNHVYYNLNPINAAPTAGSIDDDGSNNTPTANASWRGFARGTTWDLTDGFASAYQTKTIIRAEGYNAQGTGKGFAGGTLRSFATATNTGVATVGTLPTDITNISCSSLGANALCTGSNASQVDIFFINAETTDSMLRITTTPTTNETPIY